MARALSLPFPLSVSLCFMQVNLHPFIAVHIFPEKATRLLRMGKYNQITNWEPKPGEKAPT